MESKRIYRSTNPWQIIVIEQEASGLSAPKFCERRGIGYSSFMQWRKSLTGTNVIKPTVESPFVEITGANAASEHATRWLVELDLGDGIYLRVARTS